MDLGQPEYVTAKVFWVENTQIKNLWKRRHELLNRNENPDVSGRFKRRRHNIGNEEIMTDLCFDEGRGGKKNKRYRSAFTRESFRICREDWKHNF